MELSLFKSVRDVKVNLDAAFLYMMYPYNRTKRIGRSSTSFDNYFAGLNCHFVHIPKTAGTSIGAFLSGLSMKAGEEGSNNNYIELKRLSKHAKAAEIRKVYGCDYWNKLYTFSFVRNPWELMVSSYFWWRQIAYQGTISRG